MKRRDFVKSAALGGLTLSALSLPGCQNKATQKVQNEVTIMKDPFFKLSLAQWSINKSITQEGMDPFDFASVGSKLGFDGLEYVNQLYENIYEKAENKYQSMKNMAVELDKRSRDHGIKNLLIMIDHEGDLATNSREKRMKSIENHKRWVDIAHYLGCHSIRINLFSETNGEEQLEVAVDSMMRLGDYSKDFGLNILAENHGGKSSDPNWLTSVIKNTNMDNCGVLVDFGNWCIKREDSDRWDNPCINEFPDKYRGVEILMPFAKAISAKAYSVDEEGNEPTIDFYKMVKIIKDSGYTDYISVEYEGPDEIKGIEAIRDLLIKASRKA